MATFCETRGDQISVLTCARNNIRDDPSIESLLIERVIALPEDTSCHFARESLQFGAGYAYSLVDDGNIRDILVCDEADNALVSPHIAEAFFATLPRNRHVSPSVARQHQEDISRLVARALRGEAILPLPPSIDAYQFEAFIAFIEGYQLVTQQT